MLPSHFRNRLLRSNNWKICAHPSGLEPAVTPLKAKDSGSELKHPTIPTQSTEEDRFFPPNLLSSGPEPSCS